MKILITGGASGLGEAITRLLGSDTTNQVYFTYNTSLANADKIKREIPNTFPIKCDYKNEEEVTVLCEIISEIAPDVLINNAYTGSFIASYFHKTGADDFLNGFKVNVLPTILITKAAINSFRKQKKGKIITILTSALINTPPMGTSIYVANKAYLEELTKVWATENAKFNITSNSISPAFMLTPFTSALDERLIDQIKEAHPQKKLLEPEEVARTVQFLCCAGNQLNGVNIVLNAGTSIK